MTHCKKCDGRAFKDISALRRHQWAEHTEMFNNLRSAARKAYPKALANARAVREAKALVKLQVSDNGKAPMLVSELVDKLQSQHRFLSDVLSLISGMLAQHEGNK